MPDELKSDCVKERPCLVNNMRTDQTVSHMCCFFCQRRETAAGVCPFFCHVNGVPRTKMCSEMLDKRYGDIV
jgi:hypothetical protein